MTYTFEILKNIQNIKVIECYYDATGLNALVRYDDTDQLYRIKITPVCDTSKQIELLPIEETIKLSMEV